MSEWTRVVTNPLGLAGFALFLVFGVLAKVKSRDERRWLAPLACGIAALALVGGLVIAFTQAPRPQGASTSVPAAPADFKCDNRNQHTSGDGSPTVNCANGNVNITVDQRNGTHSAEPTISQKDRQQ